MILLLTCMKLQLASPLIWKQTNKHKKGSFAAFLATVDLQHCILIKYSLAFKWGRVALMQTMQSFVLMQTVGSFRPIFQLDPIVCCLT